MLKAVACQSLKVFNLAVVMEIQVFLSKPRMRLESGNAISYIDYLPSVSMLTLCKQLLSTVPAILSPAHEVVNKHLTAAKGTR